MKKLICSSFDNTLIDSDLAIPISTVLTIDDVRRKGVKFVVNTGRDVNFVKDYVRDVNFLDFIIALNGAYIYDVVHEKVIYSKKMSKVLIKKIVNKYRNDNVKIYLFTDNSKCYLNEIGEETKEIIIRDLNDFLDNNEVFKIEIHTKTLKKSKDIVLELEKFDVNANYFKFEDDNFVEIVNKNINKYIGLKKVLSKCKLKEDDVICYLNGDNDIFLINNVYSYAVSTATKDIKKNCDKKLGKVSMEDSIKKDFELG